MQCQNCHAQIPDNSLSCPYCGSPASTEQQFQGQPNPQFTGQQFQGQPNPQFTGQQFRNQPYGYAAPQMSKKDFFHAPAMKTCRNNIIGSAVCLYICAGVTLLYGILTDNLISIVDVLLIVGLALGIHLAQSRACAIIVLIYSILSVVISLIAYGQLMGWLIVVGAIYAVIATFQFRSAWEKYKQSGIFSSF